jgi:predicted dienelactone hydrolase
LEGKRPLVMFSHGRGSNGLQYAWFAEYLAARGYIVGEINHWRANTWDATIAYLANRLWQRPVDIGLAITSLLDDRTGAAVSIGPGIDRAAIHQTIGAAAQEFFDAALGVTRK